MICPTATRRIRPAIAATRHGYGRGCSTGCSWAAGAVPVAGSFLAEIADKLIRPPMERRREAWEQDVAAALETVLARQPEVDLDELGRPRSL
jgi:hypothetical protein